MAHPAWTPGPIELSPWPRGSGRGIGGINISYSAESGNLQEDSPERFLHFDVQTRTSDDPLPEGLEPAQLGGRSGRLAPATDRAYAGEPYFANHVRFFWREGGTRFVATLHNFGPGTRAVLNALVSRLKPPDELQPNPRPLGEGVRLIPVPIAAPVAVAATDNAVWVAGKGTFDPIRSPEVVPIDPHTGTASQHPVRIDGYLGPPALAVSNGVWIAHPARSEGKTLELLEPSTAKFIRAIPAGRELTAVATTKEDVLAVDLGGFPGNRGYRGGFVDRFDAETGRAVARIRVGRAPAGIAIAEDERSAWVTNSLDQTISRIDLRTNRSTEAIQVCSEPIGVATGFGAVWVACHGADAVARIDLADDRLTRIPVGNAPRGIAVGDGAVWATNNLDDTVSRIDPDPARVIETITVGTGPAGITFAHGAVWTASTYADALSRIEP